MNSPQPCEAELDRTKPTRPAGWKPQPGGKTKEQLPALGFKKLRDRAPKAPSPAACSKVASWSQWRDQPVWGLMWCPVVGPRNLPQPPCSSQGATQPAASEPGPSTPPPAKCSRRTKAQQTAGPTQPTKGKGKGKAAETKPAPQPGRWLDRDCNATLNIQRIGDSGWRPLELCWRSDQGALLFKGMSLATSSCETARLKPSPAVRVAASSKVDPRLVAYKQSTESSEHFLTALKHNVVTRPDTDGVYGLAPDELAPLPFDCPAAWEYIVDWLAAGASASSTVACEHQPMLDLLLTSEHVFHANTYRPTLVRGWGRNLVGAGIAKAQVDNDQRGIVLGDSYTGRWAGLWDSDREVTQLVMTMLTCEYLFRKMMYYRLLSMRVLVDWDTKKVWQGLFFYYFVATWILLNIWCVHGIVNFRDQGIDSPADTVQFSTFVVVNLQTMQLVLFYYRTLSMESRLVSLNQMFERDPVDAQMLLTFTYVIEEKVCATWYLQMKSDCVGWLACPVFSNRYSKAFNQHLFHQLTFGLTFKSWEQASQNARFSLSRIRGQAENAVEVEEAVAALREQMKAGRDDVTILDVVTGKEDHSAVDHPVAVQLAADTSTCGLGAAPSAPLAPDTPTATTPDAPAFTPTPSGLATMSAPTVAPSGQRVLEQPITAGAVAVKLPLATVLSSVASGSIAETWQEKEARLHQGWWGSMTLAVQKSVYSRLYGTLHGVRCAVLWREHTWPFRGDIAYFRMLCVLELIGLCSVAGVVVFGLLRATDSAR
ncbi:hypothetical protein QJQ45_021221 [Haematococcus lacustris]|nr:hypothetical protein QJQ45_021221 [Haematococcus lacustris]